MSDEKDYEWMKTAPTVQNMAQADQWSRFRYFTERLEKNTKIIKELRAEIAAIRETADRAYEIVAAFTSNMPETLRQGAGLPGPAGTAQTNAKRRSLDTQAKYAPEMTYEELYAARDARWKNGQKYRNTKEIAFAFPKSMKPQEALDAAARERYWMTKNDAIIWHDNDGVRFYAINPQWVDRFVE